MQEMATSTTIGFIKGDTRSLDYSSCSAQCNHFPHLAAVKFTKEPLIMVFCFTNSCQVKVLLVRHPEPYGLLKKPCVTPTCPSRIPVLPGRSIDATSSARAGGDLTWNVWLMQARFFNLGFPKFYYGVPIKKDFNNLESVLSPPIWENYHLARTLLPRNAPQRRNPSRTSLSGNSYLWDNLHNSCIHNTRLSCKADHRMTRSWKSFDRPGT